MHLLWFGARQANNLNLFSKAALIIAIQLPRIINKKYTRRKWPCVGTSAVVDGVKYMPSGSCKTNKLPVISLPGNGSEDWKWNGRRIVGWADVVGLTCYDSVENNTIMLPITLQRLALSSWRFQKKENPSAAFVNSICPLDVEEGLRHGRLETYSAVAYCIGLFDNCLVETESRVHGAFQEGNQ